MPGREHRGQKVSMQEPRVLKPEGIGFGDFLGQVHKKWGVVRDVSSFDPRWTDDLPIVISVSAIEEVKASDKERWEQRKRQQ